MEGRAFVPFPLAEVSRSACKKGKGACVFFLCIQRKSTPEKRRCWVPGVIIAHCLMMAEDQHSEREKQACFGEG